MPFYSEHRTVPAVLAIERITAREIDDGARQRRIAALELAAHAQNETLPKNSFAQVLNDKQKSTSLP